MLKYFLFLALTALSINGCCAVSYKDNYRNQLANAPQHYSQFDIELAWETKVEDSKTTINGVVKNIRYAYMNNLEISVSAINDKAKTVEKSLCYVIPQQLKQDDITTFSMTFPVKLEPGTKLSFSYQYEANEGNDEAMQWMQSFDSKVP